MTIKEPPPRHATIASSLVLVLKSRRVIPGRLLDAGFIFQFPSLAEALADLQRRWTAAPGD